MKSLGKTFILVVLVLLLAQSFVLVTRTYETVDDLKKTIKPTTAKAYGIVDFCINTPPDINLSDCNSTADQNEHYECWLNSSDPDYVSLVYTSLFINIARVFNASDNSSLFNVTPNGYINFTPDSYDVGNYTILFTLNDYIGCSNSITWKYFNLTVMNINDPPYLIKPIPDQNLYEGEVIYAFYLNNYFADPDNDPLTYTVTGNSSAIIQINPFTSRVVIKSDECDFTEYVIFTAWDPYNLNANSNLVRITCIEEDENPPGGGGSGGGGGGGGGLSRPCIPEYECYDYYKCRINNTKIQRCVDIHGCEPDVFLTVPCNYEQERECNETWNCTEWGPCLPNGTQYRECIDLNDCGTREFRPDVVQECEYIGTCEDGIKNCHDGGCEEGIDCGGPCPVCKSIEVPYPFAEERGILVYIITGFILLLLTAVLLYHYFRKEINAALAKAGWVISRKKRKQILLSPEDKKKLLVSIGDLENKLGRFELFELLNKYSELLRYYVVKACGKGLTSEFDMRELQEVLNNNKKRVIEVLRKIFVSTFSKYLRVEQNKALITKLNLTLLLEELRNLVLQTSKVEPEDIAREVKELKAPESAGNVERVLVMVTNTYIALEFTELEVSKKKYLGILAEYEKLGIDEQGEVYEDIARLYNNITYVNSWYVPPKE